MQHGFGMHFHACTLIFMHPVMRRGSQTRFLRSADFGDSQESEAGGHQLAVAVMHVWHACIVLHGMIDAHASCHAARARVKRARGRYPPRARPGSGLLGGSEAVPVRLCTCTLFRMPWNIIFRHRAAWHVVIRSCRLARLADQPDWLSTLAERLTLSDVIAIEYSLAL